MKMPWLLRTELKEAQEWIVVISAIWLHSSLLPINEVFGPRQHVSVSRLRPWAIPCGVSRRAIAALDDAQCLSDRCWPTPAQRASGGNRENRRCAKEFEQGKAASDG
jgi:hypothetical protein